MEVKGVAFLARQQLMVESHGEEAWRDFLTDFSRRDPTFNQPIMPVTRLPVDSFLRFNEALVLRFYKGDQKTYWQFGVKSADHALTHGHLRAMFVPGDYRRFLHFTPGIWKGYFTEGELQVKAEERYFELRLTKVSRPHIYFELSVMGFIAGGLAYLGAKQPQHEALKGFTRGDPEVLYRFYLP
jgi:hypothetical protein